MTHYNIASAFSETVSCRCLGEKALFLSNENSTEYKNPVCRGQKSLFGNTSELLLSRNSLNLLRLLKWNNTSGQNCYEYSIFLRFSYYQINHQKAKVYKTLADSTLFYCSPLFGIHYNPFSQNISLYLALFSITNKCTWYWYIIIHIAITHEQ